MPPPLKRFLPDTFSCPPPNQLILPRLRSQSWTVSKVLVQLSLRRAAAAQNRSLLHRENSCRLERSDTPWNPAASGGSDPPHDPQHLLLLPQPDAATAASSRGLRDAAKRSVHSSI